MILGTMNIAYPHSSNKDTQQYSSIIHEYLNTCDDPILDSAYYYGNTETEKILGNILTDLPSNLKLPKLTTKANPWFGNDFTTGKLGQLNKENLLIQLNTSLENLKMDSVHRFFLHCPDYETSIHETLETCDELWRQEKYQEYGLSNFSLAQTQEVLQICEKNDYRKPKVYQGMYNIVCRKVEEMFPLLNEYDIDFWGYNPLAGGLLTGKYRNLKEDLPDSRFKNNSIYQNIFWKNEILQMLENLWLKNDDYLDIALLWFKQGSQMRKNDRVILGVSSVNQYQNNMNSYNSQKNYSNIYQEFNSVYINNEKCTPNYYY
jgi:aflatoxin B1 aldehyde reductase